MYEVAQQVNSIAKTRSQVLVGGSSINKGSDLGRQRIPEKERNYFQAGELRRWQTM